MQVEPCNDNSSGNDFTFTYNVHIPYIQLYKVWALGITYEAYTLGERDNNLLNFPAPILCPFHIIRAQCHRALQNWWPLLHCFFIEQCCTHKRFHNGGLDNFLLVFIGILTLLFFSLFLFFFSLTICPKILLIFLL